LLLRGLDAREHARLAFNVARQSLLERRGAVEIIVRLSGAGVAAGMNEFLPSLSRI